MQPAEVGQGNHLTCVWRLDSAAVGSFPDGAEGNVCAGPQAKVKGRRGVRLVLRVSYLEGRWHLPLVVLQRAA